MGNFLHQVCELCCRSSMRLVILDNTAQVAEWSAKYVLKKIKDFKPGPDKYFVLGLPTGEAYKIILGCWIALWIYINLE